MSGRTCSLLLALCLPALLSATCNPKKTRPAADAAVLTVEAVAEPPGPAPAPECPPPEASAPPAGAVVGPACPPAQQSADPGLAKQIDEKAQELAAGLSPVGSAFGGKVASEPLVLGRTVLQGPPHCYVIVVLCADGASAVLRVAAQGSRAVAEGPGPSISVCPAASGPHSIAISTDGGERACAARLYGD
jgi:hypothetical protein